MLLSNIKQAGKFAAKNSTTMKQTLPALLPGLIIPAMMLTLFSLSACKKSGASPAPTEDNGNAGGTAFVTSSGWSYPGGWSDKQAGDHATYYSTKYTDIPAPQITDEIVKHGIVLVYFNPSDDGSFTALPYKLESIAHDYNFSFEYSKGNIRVHFYYSHNQRSAPMPSLAAATVKDYTFKYVVVPGAATVKQQKDGIRLTRYETIDRYSSVTH